MCTPILSSAGILSVVGTGSGPVVGKPVMPGNNTAWECPSAEDKGHYSGPVAPRSLRLSHHTVPQNSHGGPCYGGIFIDKAWAETGPLSGSLSTSHLVLQSV